MEYGARMVSATPQRATERPCRTWRLDSDKLAWREIKGGVVALDIDAASYIQVTGSGVVLWTRLLDGAAADELADLLQVKYGIDRNVALRDVGVFIEELAGRGLLLGS